MTHKSIKRKILCLSLLLFITVSGFSQSYPKEDFRRFSLTLNGGTSLSDMNESFYFLSSNFSHNIKTTPTFGGGFQYALSPAWSLELGYQHAQIKGYTVPFETRMNMLTLKNILNLNQLIFVNNLSGRLNPFVSLGIGYDFYNYMSPTEHFSDSNTSLNTGIGIFYRLSNSVDLFSHYEYHVGSNEIDNMKDGWGADMINTVTGGIRVHFGQKKAKHLSWRTVPLNLKESDYNRYLAQADQIKRQANQINMQTNQIEEMQRQLELLAQQKEEFTNLYAANDDVLELLGCNEEGQPDNTSSAFVNRQCIEVAKEPPVYTLMAAGHYVQIFANRNFMVSNYIRGHAQEALKTVAKNTDYTISLYHRDGFFEVMIGRFNTIDEAQEIRKVLTEVYEDAFIITFPRATANPRSKVLAKE